MKPRMSRLQRAKQFMPFAALRGFEALLAAEAKPKEKRAEKSEDLIEEIKTDLQSERSGDRLLQQTKIYGTYRSC